MVRRFWDVCDTDVTLPASDALPGAAGSIGLQIRQLMVNVCHFAVYDNVRVIRSTYFCLLFIVFIEFDGCEFGASCDPHC